MGGRVIHQLNVALEVREIGGEQGRSKKVSHGAKVNKWVSFWAVLWATCEEGAPLPCPTRPTPSFHREAAPRLWA